jgi:hypothetical protein
MATSEQLWGAIYALETEDANSADLTQPVIDRLVKMGFVELKAGGEPKLTAKGHKAFIVMESGNGEVPELDDAP